jgi:peptidoglycan/LPS O-acetylase OafA/YrhL
VGVLEIFNLQPGWQMVWTRTLGYAVLVLLATLQPAGIRLSFLSHPWLVWFGLRSYSIYLLHELIVGLAHGYFKGEAPEIHQWSDFGLTFAALVVTLVISALSYSRIEAPMMKIGHKLRYAE